MNEMRPSTSSRPPTANLRRGHQPVMLATYWHSYSYVMNPRKLDEAEAMGHGVFQVMVLLAPYCRATHGYCLRNWHLSIVNKVRRMTHNDDE